MDAFFASSDSAAFDAVASPNITVHADLLILDNDISGADKVKSTLQTYTSAFEYKHENIAHGADIDGSSVFHFWLHQVNDLPCHGRIAYACKLVAMYDLAMQQHASLQAISALCVHTMWLCNAVIASDHVASDAYIVSASSNQCFAML